MTTHTAPTWAALLTDDDEWIVRTALANVASDLERVADEQVDPNRDASPVVNALRESVKRYRATLARIELADA